MAKRNPKLDAIYDVFDKHGVEIGRDSIWEVQGTPVVKHKDVERLGAKLNIRYDVPTFVRTERDEAVILVVGHLGDRMEWSIGEARIVKDNEPGGNYKVSGKQAGYVYAMAEKRAKDRVILKLADLHGDVYSEEESDEFKQGRGGSSDEARPVDRVSAKEEPRDQPQNDNVAETKASKAKTEEVSVEDDLKQKITKAKTINAVTDLMLHADTQRVLNDLPEEVRDQIRDFAKARLVELGWPTKATA